MKKFWTLMALLCSVIGFTAAAAELASYAPSDTEVIIYVNARQFANSRTFHTMLQQYPNLKAEFKKIDAEAQKEAGVSLPQLLNAEYCTFFNIKNLEKNEDFDLIVRTGDPIVGTFLEHMAKNNKAAFSNVSGKRMLKSNDGDGVFIELSSNMLCASKSRTTPLVPGYSKLAAGIDTDALISVAVDFSAVKDEDFNQEPLKSIFWQMKRISANLREVKDGLHGELVAEYGNVEAAQKAHTIVSVLAQTYIDEAKKSSPETAQALSKLNLQLSGTKIILSWDTSDKELWDAINAAMATATVKQ